MAWNRTDGNQNQSWTLTYEGDWHDFTDAGTTQQRTHGPAHELTAIDGTGLTYDAKGNLTQNVTGDTYTWDFDNQLRTATVSGAVTTLAYDALRSAGEQGLRCHDQCVRERRAAVGRQPVGRSDPGPVPQRHRAEFAE